jgi:hypothetical protein
VVLGDRIELAWIAGNRAWQTRRLAAGCLSLEDRRTGSAHTRGMVRISLPASRTTPQARVRGRSMQPATREVLMASSAGTRKWYTSNPLEEVE